MKIFEINSGYLRQQFLELPRSIYSNQPLWTVQLGHDIEHAFYVNANSLSEKDRAARWLVYDEMNRPSGRIAAFTNKEEGMGAFGFFECVKCQSTANLLLGTAEEWLRQNGCLSMQGPLNFYEKDRFWGLLTEGFHKPALYLENYNRRYYENLLRGYGLKEYETLFTCSVSIDEMPLEKLHRVAERFREMHQITVRNFSFQQAAQIARDIHEIYSNDVDPCSRFRKLSVEDIQSLIKMSRPVIEENMIWLAYQNNQPVGVLAFLIDLNQVIRRKFKHQRDERINLKGFVFSVVPGRRNFEVEVALGDAFCTALLQNEKNYDLHFSGINKHSSQMISFLTTMNASITTTHKTFINTPRYGTIN